MNATTPYKTIIRFDQAAAQEDGAIKRIVGFVHAKNMLALFDDATLDANPRSAKTNNVTADIVESVNEAPGLFQFKTKGILLGTSDYQQLQRNRFELNFNNPAYEGLLDGGHNMLALGTHLLGFVLDPKEVRKIKLWEDFKQQWATHRDQVKAIRDQLNFKVPVELLVPSDVDDEEVVQEFTMALMDICAARNNNAQLTTEAKANQRGFYEEIRKRMPPALAERVEWKTNEWESDHRRAIKVRDLIALAWIPLTVLQDDGLLPTESEAGTNLKFGVLPQNIYRNKGELSKLFDRLMEHPDVSKPTNGPLHELHNALVGSAFDILADLPALFDKVYMAFPDAYNKAVDGKFGKIKAVKYRDGKKLYASPFFGHMSAYGVPEPFVLPIIYGLKALLRVENGKLKWIEDPSAFVDRHIKSLVGAFRLPMDLASFDPQKIGKNEGSYSFMVGEVEKALIRERASA